MASPPGAGVKIADTCLRRAGVRPSPTNVEYYGGPIVGERRSALLSASPSAPSVERSSYRRTMVE
jgi:hypothetical protein